MNREKLMKMAGSVRTGGKGTVRRYFHTFNLAFHLNKKTVFYVMTILDFNMLRFSSFVIGFNVTLQTFLAFPLYPPFHYALI